MGCEVSKEDDGDVEQARGAAHVKPTPGPPTKLYPYVLERGQPKVLGSGAYSVVLEATNKVRQARGTPSSSRR